MIEHLYSIALKPEKNMKALKISLIFFLLLNVGFSSQTKPKYLSVQEVNKALTQKRAKDLDMVKKILRDKKIWNPFK